MKALSRQQLDMVQKANLYRLRLALMLLVGCETALGRQIEKASAARLRAATILLLQRAATRRHAARLAVAA